MDENEAVAQQQAATPIFNVYRRGYDPEQVDRYVADQQRRLDEALYRASEAERRLAAAVGQLRELHRRVAVYESETRTAQPPSLDTLGERVQRILQEAWEGAYSLRQEAEHEVSELREAVSTEVVETRDNATREAAEIVDQATRRAVAIRDETERRRRAYLQRIEQDRERAVSQITYLHEQRQEAISDLNRLQATVQSVIEEMVRGSLGRQAPDAPGGSGGASEAGAEHRTPDATGARPSRHSGVSGSAASPYGEATDHSSDQPERVGRHGAASAGELLPDGGVASAKDDTRASRGRERPTAEPAGDVTRRQQGQSLARGPETVPVDRTRPNSQHTGLFDVEKEGWV
jgi:cell division septum initiation protein DivIVA